MCDKMNIRMVPVNTRIFTQLYIDIASFSHNAESKTCLRGQKSNNVRVGFNKHLKNWHNLLGRHLMQRISDHFWLKIIMQYISLENIG